MGEVYQAYDRRLDRWVAIKPIRPEAAENERARERFRREARAA
jgi:serine/threonine protein kinase